MNSRLHLQLVLASSSPRRRNLLNEMGLRFAVVPAAVEEWFEAGADPRSLVLHNCRLKTEFVVADGAHAHCPVLGADTTVALDGVILNKPGDLEDARRMLGQLSGRTHTVFTGICLIFRERNIDETLCVTSEVTFRQLDEEGISRYLSIVDPLDKAGAYGIQEGREIILENLEGSFSNVMGLPVEETLELLQKHGLWEALRLPDTGCKLDA